VNLTDGLLQFANSERQREAIKALDQHGSATKGAKALGITRASFQNLIIRAKRQAALHGWSPEHDMVHPTSPVHVAKGTSTLYDEDGKPIMQWVKTSLKHDQMLEVMREAAEEMKADIKPVKPIKPPTKPQLAELLNLYILTDAHFGMRSWAEETDANWDLEIAEKTVLEAFSHLIHSSPNSETGFLLQLGDALHSDGLLAITPTSHHVLDADGRFPKVVRTIIRVMRQCTNMLLAKHDKVVLLHAQGNHDPASSVWLQEWFSVLYENEPRIQVIVSPKPYYAYKHGDVLLGAHHGHKRSKLSDLVRLFVDEFRGLHGQTKRTYIHAGHFHSDDLFADGSTRAERHETLAARDAYATHGGYRAGRSMKCITYNHQAEIGRSFYYPEAL
jgi:hypothetical protein